MSGRGVTVAPPTPPRGRPMPQRTTIIEGGHRMADQLEAGDHVRHLAERLDLARLAFAQVAVRFKFPFETADGAARDVLLLAKKDLHPPPALVSAAAAYRRAKARLDRACERAGGDL